MSRHSGGRRAAAAASIEDLRIRARRRLPRAVFAYVEGGSYDEVTLRRNREDLEALSLEQRVMVDVSSRSPSTTMLGQPAVMPVALTPVGLAGLTYPNGEIHAVRAALEFGVPACVSTLSIASINEISEAVDGPFWFQLYLLRDRGFCRSMIDRAKAANCPALVMTLDLHVRSQRHHETRYGLSIPPRLTLSNMTDVVLHPQWAFPMLASKRFCFGNLIDVAGKNLPAQAEWLKDQYDPSIDPRLIQWVRDQWPGKVVLKGILHPEDARTAVRLGADAIVVSNHGGRQMGSAPSTVSVLPEIVDAVGGQIEIYVDGGIRSGFDVLKCLGLGADACFIGRSYVYGLAANGQAGVRQALDLLRGELEDAMAFTGTTDVSTLTDDLARGARERLVRRPRAPSSLPPRQGGQDVG